MKKTNYKKVTISGLFWSFGEKICVKLISFVVSVILARLLDPEHYAIIALTSIFITICDTFVTSGFATALVQKEKPDELDYSSIFYSSLTVSIVLYSVLFFSAPYIEGWFDTPQLASVIRVLGLRLPISALGSVQQSYVRKHYMFKKFFWSTLVGTVISAGIGLFMAYMGLGVWALVSQIMINVVIDKIVLLITVPWKPRLMFSFKRAITLMNYGWKILALSLFDIGCSESYSVIIGLKYSSTDLAFINKGDSLPKLLGSYILDPIRMVLLPVLSDNNADKVRVKEMIGRSISVAAFVMFPMLTGLAVIAPTLIPILFTEKWSPCIPYLQLLCVLYALQPITSINTISMQSSGRGTAYLLSGIVSSLIQLLMLFVMMPFGTFQIVIGQVISIVARYVIFAENNKRIFSISLVEQLFHMLPCFIFSVVMAVPVYLVNFLNISIIVKLVCQIALGIIVYLICSFIFKPKPFVYLLSMLNDYRQKIKMKNNKD